MSFRHSLKKVFEEIIDPTVKLSYRSAQPLEQEALDKDIEAFRAQVASFKSACSTPGFSAQDARLTAPAYIADLTGDMDKFLEKSIRYQSGTTNVPPWNTGNISRMARNIRDYTRTVEEMNDTDLIKSVTTANMRKSAGSGGLTLKV
jgi:hypothetical protein